MKNKAIKIYVSTKPCVDKKYYSQYNVMVCEALKSKEKFNRLEKISYAIRLMAKGISKDAFKAMFKDNLHDLEIANMLVKKEKILEK